LAVVGTLVEAVLSNTPIVASGHDQWLIHGPLVLLMVVICFIIWRIERGQRRTNAAMPPPAADQDTVEEIGCRLAAASNGASATIEPTAAAGQDAVEEIGCRRAAASEGVSATIEPTVVAGQDTVEEIGCRLAAASNGASATIEPTVVVRPDATVEEIGRRLAAMLAEKGIPINLPQCELRRRGSGGATVEATAVVGQYTVEEIVATLAKKGILINSPKCDQDIFEKIGRRLAGMLAEKGIVLNSRNRSG
jgi:hypothetical protein